MTLPITRIARRLFMDFCYYGSIEENATEAERVANQQWYWAGYELADELDMEERNEQITATADETRTDTRPEIHNAVRQV